ncbi:hypothetical protein LINPERHAP2_LOCUS30023 [Linum perenne]
MTATPFKLDSMVCPRLSSPPSPALSRQQIDAAMDHLSDWVYESVLELAAASARGRLTFDDRLPLPLPRTTSPTSVPTSHAAVLMLREPEMREEDEAGEVATKQWWRRRGGDRAMVEAEKRERRWRSTLEAAMDIYELMVVVMMMKIRAETDGRLLLQQHAIIIKLGKIAVGGEAFPAMGISSTAHIYPFRPLPVSPSYLRFYRPCPCLSAASSSPPSAIRVAAAAAAAAAYTLPFSRHRFWGQLPSGVVVNLRRRDDKRYLASGNYTTSTYLDTTTTYNESRMQWTKECICVRESRSRVTQDNSAHLQDGGSCSLNHAEFLKMRVVAKVESRKSENGAITGENHSGITNGRSKDFSLLTPEERVRTSSSFSGQPKSSFGNVGVGFACGREYDLPMMLETEVKCNGSTNGVTVAADGSSVTNSRPNGFSSLVLEERAKLNGSLKMSMNGSAIASKKTNGLSSVAVSKSFKPLAHDVNGSATRRLDSSTSNTVQEIAKTNGSLASDVVRHSEGSNFVEIKSKGSSYTPNGKVAVVADTADPANAKEFQTDIRNRLISISNNVLVVDNVSTAKAVVSKLTHQYKHHVHACDTEVSNIDLKVQTPIDHGELICFSIYSGPEADYGNGKSCIWVDVLDGAGQAILAEFKIFFENESIKKVSFFLHSSIVIYV